MDPQILKSQRLKEVVEISQSMLEGDYEGLRKNRMICVESFKMAAIFTHTDIKEKIYQKEMKSICVRQWINYFKDLKIKELKKVEEGIKIL